MIIRFVIIHNVPWFLPNWTGRACRLGGHDTASAADSVLDTGCHRIGGGLPIYRAFTLAEIGDYFGLHYCYVSRVVQTTEQFRRKTKLKA